MPSDSPSGASSTSTSSSGAERPDRPASPSSRRGGLGRGLEALIPAFGAGAVAATLDIDIDAISPNPYQPRLEMDQEALETLAASIRVHGVIQPLVVTQSPERGRFVLIAGERRWRAAPPAGGGAGAPPGQKGV